MIKRIFAMLIAATLACMASCTKDKEDQPSKKSVNNTTWQAEVTITGNAIAQNLFEFANNGAYFAWRPVGYPSYTGSWTQNGATVNFIFLEETTSGKYFWDNTGTLSSDGITFTGTMQRRGQQGSGTFTAKKL
jgi:hypothetical protein